MLKNAELYLKKLVKTTNLIAGEEIEKPAKSASAVLSGGIEIYIPLAGLIDIDKEKERLEKEMAGMKSRLIGVEKKLSNEKFVNSAPESIVNKEKQKFKDFSEKLEKLEENYRNL